MGEGLRVLSRVVAAGRRLPPGWQIYVLFPSFPLWWALGVDVFVWPFLTLPLLLSLFWRGGIRVPPGFGLWLLFLVWMMASATRVEGDGRWLAFVYRGSLYFSATILFLYVYNASRQALPDRIVVATLACYWVLVAVGGFLGILFPTFSFRSLAGIILPTELLNIGFVEAIVQRGFAQVQRFIGYPVPRPKTLFSFSNAWGANFAILVPFVLATLEYVKSRLGRGILIALFVSSIVPLVFSLNRGAWLSLGLGLAYAAIRFTLRGNLRALGPFLLLFAVTGLLLFYTPVGEIADDRIAHPHSNEGRLSLYQEAIERVTEAPLLGFGTPLPSEERPDTPSVGTHGQMPLVLFSHGIPGLIFFLGWFLYTLLRSGRGGSNVRFWAHVVILIALIQAPYYELLPMPLHTIMVAAALAWREMAFTVQGDTRASSTRRYALTPDR